MRVLLVVLFALCVGGAPLAAFAMPTINCHCFRDRSFDPQQPQAADGYFLATAQNSFFAARFNISKKSLVMKKQQGVASEDLWLAYWLGEKSGQPADLLLSRKQADESWSTIMDQLALDRSPLGKALVNALAVTLNESAAVTLHPDQLIVDEILVNHSLISGDELQRLRNAAATNQMVILLVALSDQQSQTAEQLYSEVLKDGRIWGELVDRTALNPKQLLPQFTRLLGGEE